MGVTMSNSDYTSMSSMPSYEGMGSAPSSSTSSSSSKPDNSSSKSSGSTGSTSSGSSSSSSSSSSSKPDNSASKESGSYSNSGGGSDSESGRMSNSDYGSMSSMPSYGGMGTSSGSSSSGSDTARTSLVAATGGLMPSLNAGASLAGGGYVPMTTSSNSLAVNPIIGVVSAGGGWTQVKYADGTIELRQGDRASRNNNPGNLEYASWMRDYGAVGWDDKGNRDRPMAVFATPEDGLRAQAALLDRPMYADKTISDAIKTYAPPNENNSAAYAKTIADRAGVSVDTKMSDLTAAQRESLIAAMQDVEGNTGYRSTVQMAGTIGTGAPGTGSSSPSQSPVSQLALNDIPTPPAADRSALPASGGLLAGLSPVGSASAGELVRTNTGYQVPEIVDAVKANPESMTPAEYAAYQAELQRTMQTADYARMPSLPSYATEDYSRYLQGSPQVYDKEATQSAGGTQTSPVETFREKYLSDPWDGTRTADAQPAKAEQPGLGKQLLAGAIDVGAGFIPGVGTAATVFNAGAGLMGKPTIGQRIVNGIGTGTGSGETIDTGSSDDSEAWPRRKKTDDEETDPVESFADKYLKPVLYDGNWQTPAEKWGAV